MPTPHEKLAESLTVLQTLQQGGRRVIQSRELTRAHRERLLANGFLQEVMKGWLISSSPGARDGDSTPWYASLWEFCARYCNERFGKVIHHQPSDEPDPEAYRRAYKRRRKYDSGASANAAIWPLPAGTTDDDYDSSGGGSGGGDSGSGDSSSGDSGGSSCGGGCGGGS